MKILITGGSGFLGTALTKVLQTQGINGESVAVTWVSRSVEKEKAKNIASHVISYDDLATTQENFDILINLAGAGIADKRWTDARKAQLLDSRIRPTQAVIDYIQRMTIKPKRLISGSAIGWYGIQPEGDPTALDENNTDNAKHHPDFSHELCQTWEKMALSVQSLLPVTIIRTGVVIDPDGGMLTRLLTPFKMGVGGKLGTGQQMMSWISRDDWVRAVVFIIEQSLDPHLTSPQREAEHNSQIYNLTAPTPITNLSFTKTLGKWLHRPTLLTLPKFLLKLIFGEMGTLLFDGQRVVPKRLLEQGFVFKDDTMLQAL